MDGAARTRIRLCGRLEIEVDGRNVTADVPAGQTRSVLAYLVANRERASDRAELIDVVWSGRPPKDPQAVLRPVLSRLRRALEPVTLEGRDRLRLSFPEPVWIDAEQATTSVEAARSAASRSEWERVREQSEVARDLLSAGFLADHEGEWVDVRRRELEELELEALEWIARSGLAQGGPGLRAAERAGRELVARSTYRETGYRFLMQALAANGNGAEALRVYEELRGLLRDELGAAPAPEVQTLHQRILAGESTGSITAASPARQGQAASRRVPLPVLLSPRERAAFIGRESELDALREAWRQARSGSRQLVLLTGEPGIGKTRLTSEFAVQAHPEGTVLYSGCQEETLLPYQPFVEALRHFALSQPFDETLMPPGPGAAELARLIPELDAEVPRAREAPPEDPETRRYLMFEAVSSLLIEAASRTPLLLVMDDLHWADRPTLQLLRHIMRAPRSASLLIVGAYRDAELGAGHPVSDLLADLRRERLFERISLRGLDESDVGALIVSHAGPEASSALVRAVHEETGGNPFFVEEVMRHLIETGVLFERQGRWTSALTVDEIGVPEGVKEVLERRLNRLSEASRAMLAHAGVLGREFSFEVLRGMVELDEDALIAALEEVLDAQLVVEEPGRSGPSYGFTHALVREALYEGLTGARAQRLHGRAARAIEQAEGSEGEPQVAALAVHYRLAGAAGDTRKAIDYSLRAGERARELYAWEEAAAHWDGAVELMARADEDEETRARILVALADLMVVIGGLDRQIGYLERALDLYRQVGDAERTAQVHSRLGMAHSLIDSIFAEFLDIPRAFRHYDAAREVLDRGPVRKARGHLETGVSTALTYGLEVERGIEAAVRGMEIAEQLGDDLLWAGAAEAFGWHKIVAGDLSEGLDSVERAFRVADRRRRPFLAWMASTMSGQMTWGLGDPDGAQAHHERSLMLPYAGKTAYREQVADGVGRCHASRGEIAEARRLLSDAKPTWITHSLKPLVDLWEGNWREVESLARNVLDASRRAGNRWDEWASHHLAARVFSLRGEHETAAERLEQALAIVVDGGAPYFEMWVRPDLARARAETGGLEESRAQVERCREILARGEDWRGRTGHVDLADAVVLALEDRMDAAEVAFRQAIDTLRRHRLRSDEADALHEWGRALARAGDAGGAAEKLDSALGTYRRLGAGTARWERVEADRRELRMASR